MSAGAPAARPSTSAGSSDSAGGRTLWGVIAGVAVLLVIAGGAVAAVLVTSQGGDAEAGSAPEATAELIAFPDDEPASAAGAAPCTTVTVLSSLENSEMVTRLVEGYNAQPRDVDGSCVTVVATKDKSGLAAEDAAVGFPDRAEAERPTVWIPDASSWLAVARDGGGGANVPEEGTSIGSSDIVVGMPESLAAAIGWDEERPTWDDVFAAADDEDAWSSLGHPEWGGFKLGKTSPLIASSGEAALLASYGSAAGSVSELTADQIADPDVTEEVRQHELSTSHYMATPEHFLWHARQSEEAGSVADFLSAVIVDEKSVWDYNRGITSRDGVNRIESDPPEEKLVPIYPSDGFYVADNPAVVLTGGWVDDAKAAAAEDFLQFTGTQEGQQIVRESGYRDLNREFDPMVAEVGQYATDQTGALLPLRERRDGHPRGVPRGAQAGRSALPRRRLGLDVGAHRDRAVQARRGEGCHHGGARLLHRRRQRRPRRVLRRRRRTDHPCPGEPRGRCRC